MAARPTTIQVNLSFFNTGCLAFLAVVSSLGAEVRFNRDIRPILSDKCFACHGPDAKAVKGKLRLDQRDSALKVIEPGKPSDSELIRRVTTRDKDDVMPPPETHKKVNRKEAALLREWIQAGAGYEGHWAFIPVRRPELPRVKSAWPRNGIDAFVVEGLAKHRLKPSARAERQKLIRRVTLDLTGLPPSPEAVKAFVRAGDFEKAYAGLVDELLASPRFGEHLAWWWLDAARYADSDGYESDPLRNMWPWRDWVVKAFNENKSYDEFVIEQLAGDMLPGPTLMQQLATGFNRNHRLNNEGGILPEEWRVEYVCDRAETTATVFLGLTWGCARCHDHKYDPVTQKDYYQLFAFFNNLEEIGNGRGANNAPPMIDMPRLENAEEYAVLLTEKAPLDAKLKAMEGTAEFRKQFAAWFDGLDDPANAKLAAAISKKKVAQWGAAEKNLARTHYLENVHPGAAEFRKAYLALKRRETQLVRTGSKVMVMAEMEKPRPAHILNRGAYDQPTTLVTANTPSFLPGFDAQRTRTRLDLGRWLMDRNNPLTSRVAVNRLWELFFGVGLVKTQEDFGAQGEPPSHPDLLDHLAWRFMDSGWDIKALLKYIVTSATYQQTSKGDTGSYLADPENRLLSRGPRYRLPAQMIRDQALAAAGLLVNEIGGPPVKPYQPEGLWKEIIKGRVEYKRDTGDKLYRRSLYTLWRRAVKPPEMMLFDANDRDTCEVARKRTNTPLQALMLLNDVTFVETSRALAVRMIRAGGDCPDCRFENGMQFVLGRSPTRAEIDIMRNEFYASFAGFRNDPAAAKKLLSEGESTVPADLDEGELAAYAMVARILLNLDETLTKE